MTQETVEVPEQVVKVKVQDEPAPLQTKDGFTAEDIAKARQQEKDKLYADQQRLKAELDKQSNELKALREAREKEEADRAKVLADAEAAKKKAAEEELSAKELIALQRKEFDEKLAEITSQQELERATFQKEREFNQLATYTQQVVADAISAGEVAPELADFITGNTQEQVNASLEAVKAKSNQIAQNIAAATQVRAPQRGVATTGYASTGPLDNEPGTKTYTAEELRDLPMSEYARLRPQLLGGASANQNRGMYG